MTEGLNKYMNTGLIVSVNEGVQGALRMKICPQCIPGVGSETILTLVKHKAVQNMN